MNEIDQYPELLDELQKQPGLKEEVLQIKANFKPLKIFTLNNFLDIRGNYFQLLSGLKLLPLIKKGYDVKLHNTIFFAQDRVALQLLQYFGASTEKIEEENNFDVYLMSPFMLEECWDKVKHIILNPKIENSPIYLCDNYKIFEIIKSRGITVDDIIYPKLKYKYKEKLFTYDIVYHLWRYSNKGNWVKGHTFNHYYKKIKVTQEVYDEFRRTVNYIVNIFDDFSEEIIFQWRGLEFKIPKWYLYLREYFIPFRSNNKLEKHWPPYKGNKENFKEFFELFKNLKINSLSSTGVNLYFMLLDCQINDMLFGIEQLIDFNINPLQKDIKGISFYDILLSNKEMYQKAIDLINNKIATKNHIYTSVTLDENSKTSIIPIIQYDKNLNNHIKVNDNRENPSSLKSDKKVKSNKELQYYIDEFARFPELFSKISNNLDLMDEIILERKKKANNIEVNGIVRRKINDNDYSVYEWDNLMRYVKRGLNIEDSLIYAQDIYSCQLMLYLGAKPISKIQSGFLDIYKASLFILDLYWDEIKPIIYQPQRRHYPIYLCNRFEIFKFLKEKNVKVDDIVYLEKGYENKYVLYTYEIVFYFWNYHNLLKKTEFIERKNDIGFLVYNFDDFRDEIVYEWSNYSFKIPKWFLYFREYFKPNWKTTLRKIYSVPSLSDIKTNEFFKLFDVLNINQLSSSGTNILFMLLECNQDNMIEGIKHLMAFGLSPLYKDKNSVSFYDLLLSCDKKYSKVISYIESKINTNNYDKKIIELDFEAETKLIPFSKEDKFLSLSTKKEIQYVYKENVDIKIGKDPKISINNNFVYQDLLDPNQRYTLIYMRNYFDSSVLTNYDKLSSNVINSTTDNTDIKTIILFYLLILSRSSENQKYLEKYKDISTKLNNIKIGTEDKVLIEEIVQFFNYLYTSLLKTPMNLLNDTDKYIVLNALTRNRYSIFNQYIKDYLYDKRIDMSILINSKNKSKESKEIIDLNFEYLLECIVNIETYVISVMLKPFNQSMPSNLNHKGIFKKLTEKGNQ